MGRWSEDQGVNVILKVVNVYLWDTFVGSVSAAEGNLFVRFEYSPDIRNLGVEISPYRMPLSGGVYSFPDLSLQSFHGLPGLLSDSLPDKFGNKVIAAYLRSRKLNPEDLTSIDRLAYAGKRGMGALEYRPAMLDDEDKAERIEVDSLAELANAVLKMREDAKAELVEGMTDYAPILRVGSSAGGARAKALIGWNEATGEVRSGQVKLPSDFGYWLIKFDGLAGNGDKEGDDKWGYGRVEYAYYLMAKAAGIDMTECRLWNRRHFMTRRFDRTLSGGKLHMQTLGALAHFDFNNPSLYSYEQAFRITRQVLGDIRAERELFRRMVFNVLAWNCDDHVKNISYLMDRDGRWTLAPAYDECYSYNPNGAWTSGHQMSVNGKKIGISDEDMIAAGRIGDLRPKECESIISEVREVVRAWPQFAAEAEVKDEFVTKIGKVLSKEIK